MSGPTDLHEMLKSWPYDPENSARIVRGDDGREILQVRLPLGVEQYELEGRPDGQRPHRMESVLDYHLERLARAKAAGTEGSFALGREQCAELFHEGTLYYFRYLHLSQIKDWQRTLRDTSRNLALFDFIHRYAEREEDQMYLEQWRPYLLRIQTAAAAMLELGKGAYDKALAAISTAIDRIEALPEMAAETFAFERQRSLVALREMASRIEDNKPLSPLQGLERDLEQAIENQHFERAAELRDRIRALRQQAK